PDVPEPELGDHGASCDRPCLPLLEQALKLGGPPESSAEEMERWCEAWVSVRSACPIGREHTYAEDQTLYHYTKNPAVLEASLTGLGG
ncbi:MAG: hypothetical protein ACOCVR_02335, partial [Myxococcota bacterium]